MQSPRTGCLPLQAAWKLQSRLIEDFPLLAHPMQKPPDSSVGVKSGLKSSRDQAEIYGKCKGLPSSMASPPCHGKPKPLSKAGISSQHGTMISCHAECFPQGCTLEDTVEQEELTSLQLCLQMALPLSAKRNEKQCKPWSLGSTTAKLLIPELHRPVSAISFATVVSRSSADESSPSS